ncbi:MAG: fatty acid desaturase [Byssovorax sp.]
MTSTTDDDLHPVHVYARALRAELPRDVFDPVPARLGWLLLAPLIAAAEVLLCGHDLPPWAAIPLGLAAGQALASLAFLGHELLHGSVVRAPWLRSLLGALCFLPFGISAAIWHRGHNLGHHGHTQHPVDDPDAFDTFASYRDRGRLRALYALPRFAQRLFVFLAFAMWFSFYAMRVLPRYRADMPRRALALTYATWVIPLLAAMALGLSLGPRALLFGFVIPIAAGNFVLMAHIGTNHLLNPVLPVNDPLATSLSVLVPRWYAWLTLGFCHHTEHHVLPAVSPRHARAIKALLKRRWPDRYHELPMFRALRLIWQTPRLYGEDGVSLVSPDGERSGTLGHGLSTGERASAPGGAPSPAEPLHG